jgi:hypothetical protein
MINITNSRSILAVRSFAAPHPNFSGDWILDNAKTVGQQPWGQTHVDSFVIDQNADELTLVINTDSYLFRFDGAVHSVLDISTGNLANFVRKTETVAEWKGGSHLILKLTEVAEQTDRKAREKSRHPGITNVHSLQLSADGTQLFDDRTGYREEQSRSLHGRPYERSDDFAYRTQKAVFVKRH